MFEFVESTRKTEEPEGFGVGSAETEVSEARTERRRVAKIMFEKDRSLSFARIRERLGDLGGRREEEYRSASSASSFLETTRWLGRASKVDQKRSSYEEAKVG